MKHHTVTAAFQAPREELFAYLAEIETLPPPRDLSGPEPFEACDRAIDLSLGALDPVGGATVGGVVA